MYFTLHSSVLGHPANASPRETCVSKLLGRLITALAICAIFGSPTVSAAFADAYPSRSVSIVVPFSPGAVTDILARIAAEKLSSRLGQPFVIENKPGAGTLLAADGVANAAPDGYTLLVATSSTLSINGTLYKSLPYDPANSFVPVSLLCSVPFILVTRPDLPVKTAGDLIRLAKDKPGQLDYGSGGIGTTASVLISLLKSMTATDMTEVVYRGITPALNDLMGGNIQFMFSDIGTVAPFIKNGSLRALGVSTKERFKGAPDIPTLAENGVPGFAGDSWQMLVAPAKTSKDIVNKLNAAANEILNTPDVTEKLLGLGMTADGKEGPAELQAFIRAETTRWAKVVTDAGFAKSQ